MKTIFETFIRENMVDVLFWLACLFFAVRYGIFQWRDQEKSRPWLFVLFMCFYGGFLIYRLGVMKDLQYDLIQRCMENGIDLSDILP
jgi:RsiW-degrading membrane proteinase PrsW (M82 family)